MENPHKKGKLKMELWITTMVYIEMDTIREKIKKGASIEEAVDDYISGLDDCEYYLIGEEEKAKIIHALKNE